MFRIRLASMFIRLFLSLSIYIYLENFIIFHVHIIYFTMKILSNFISKKRESKLALIVGFGQVTPNSGVTHRALDV